MKCFYLLHFGASCLTWLVEDRFLIGLSFCSQVKRSVGLVVWLLGSSSFVLYIRFNKRSVSEFIGRT